MAVTTQTRPAAGSGPDWQAIQPGRWCSIDGRYALVAIDPPAARPSWRARLQTMFTGGHPSAPQNPPPLPGFLPEAGSAPVWSAVEWTPARAEAGPGATWLGVDATGGDVVLDTCSDVGAGQVRVHHGTLVGRNGTGKTSTLQNLLLPGLSAGTELVLVADGHGNSLPDLQPHLTRLARFSPARWEQVITVASEVLRSRQVRGWDGPAATDPVLTLVIDGAAIVRDGLTRAAHARVLEIARLGEALGVRIIQTAQTGATDDLIGGRAWRASTRWTIGHAVATPIDSDLATQSTDEEVSLLGLPVGHAAVISEGHVLTSEVAIARVTTAAIAAAMAGVTPAQLHPRDLVTAGRRIWADTAGWSTTDDVTEQIPDLPGYTNITRWRTPQGDELITYTTTAGTVTVRPAQLPERLYQAIHQGAGQ